MPLRKLLGWHIYTMFSDNQFLLHRFTFFQKKNFFKMIKSPFNFLLIALFVFACNEQPKTVEKTAEQAEAANQTANLTNSPSQRKKKVVLFFGDSLTAGYGLEEEQAFPSLIQNRIDSLGLEYTVINAGLSGETTSGGLNRIDWILKQDIDVFVLELGANDMLRGIEVSSTGENLKGILEKVKAKNPEVKFIIAGMLAPPNMGEDYATAFGKIFPDLAKEYNAGLIPFLLDKVGGYPELNLPDGKHPNVEGQKIVRENVWAVLKNYL